MGCDIHAYIDYDDFETDDGWWVSCFADHVNFGRNYTLFSLMAGVRYDSRTDGNFKPLFEPRGLFERRSWQVNDAYTLRVNDENDAKGWEGYCTKAEAADWVKRNLSVWVDREKGIISGPDWHSVSWLTVPELEQVRKAYESIKFYEQSWFQFKSPDEQPIPDNATAQKLPRRWGSGYEWYVTVGEAKTYQVPTTFNAIISAMKSLDWQGQTRSRLIFWFDN